MCCFWISSTKSTLPRVAFVIRNCAPCQLNSPGEASRGLIRVHRGAYTSVRHRPPSTGTNWTGSRLPRLEARVGHEGPPHLGPSASRFASPPNPGIIATHGVYEGGRSQFGSHCVEIRGRKLSLGIGERRHSSPAGADEPVEYRRHSGAHSLHNHTPHIHTASLQSSNF